MAHVRLDITVHLTMSTLAPRVQSASMSVLRAPTRPMLYVAVVCLGARFRVPPTHRLVLRARTAPLVSIRLEYALCLQTPRA